MPPGPDLLSDPLFVVVPDGPAAPLSLPDLLARLITGPDIAGFPYLTAEQRGYWWRFLVRCAAKVLHERGLAVEAASALPAARLAAMLRAYAAPAHAVAVPTDAASIQEGERLAITHGCFQGCHGSGLEGKVFIEQRWVTRLVAPDLTHAVRRYSDAELEGIIRHGVRPDGRSVFVMPSESFATLSDADLVLREAATHPAAPPAMETDSLAFGRYLARTVCAECHGTDLRGGADVGAPGLALVAAYSPADFEQLLRTGVALGGRDLGLMGYVARSRFTHLTETEVRALYGYLRSLR